MIKKLFKLLIGILAIPVAMGVAVSFVTQINNIQNFENSAEKIFLLGVILYVITHLFLFKPNYIYVFGHELVHAFSIWVCFGSVKKFKVSKNGGSVTGTKNNLFISISPYFIPIIPIIVSLIYFVVTASFEVPGIMPVFMGILGFTFAMHLIMTIDTLKIEQPDLVSLGQLFATALIVTVNVVIAGFLVSLLFDGFIFKDFIFDSYTRSRDIYFLVIRQFFYLG